VEFQFVIDEAVIASDLLEERITTARSGRA
jgi:hypothetical protein